MREYTIEIDTRTFEKIWNIKINYVVIPLSSYFKIGDKFNIIPKSTDNSGQQNKCVETVIRDVCYSHENIKAGMCIINFIHKRTKFLSL